MDLDQHLKDFLKIVDSLDLNVENRERTRPHLFQYFLRDQASNWRERLPTGSIFTWEDLTTHFLAQFFPPGRTARLKNDTLMFQQHQRESLFEAWNRFKNLLQKALHHGIDLWLQVQIFYDHINPATRRAIDQSAGDFAKLVKEISLPHDVPNTSDRHLIELENQVQRLVEAHLAPKPSVQVNNIASSCEIFSGHHDSKCYMENPEQAFVDYASSRNNKVGGEQDGNSSSPKHVHFINTITIVRKEDEPEEPRILEHNAIKGDDRNLDVYNENMLEGESKAPKIIIEEEESSDLGDNNKTSNLGDGREIGEEGEWMEYDQPLTQIKKGDPSNLKISCMIGRKDMHVFVGNMSHVMGFTILENVEAKIYPSLSYVVFGRPFVEITELILDMEHGLITFMDGIKPSDLVSEFHKDIDKLGPSYKKESERVDLEVSFEAGGSRTNVESKEMGEVDIETLTMEKYLALGRSDTRRGVRKPKIKGNVDFKIKGQFLRELRDNRVILSLGMKMKTHMNMWKGEKMAGNSTYRNNKHMGSAETDFHPKEIIKKIGKEDGLPRETPTKELRTLTEKANAKLYQMFTRNGVQKGKGPKKLYPPIYYWRLRGGNALLPKIDWDTLEVIPDSDNEIGIRLEDLGEG
nr:zinc finger, CCHC-type [Tanacetum cinerariifolium]